MASSDDEAETLPESVSNYYFLDHEDETISFSLVTCLWSVGEKPDCGKETVFLHGNADNGLKTIYKEVKAWKLDLFNVSPEISVLSKDNNWFKLQTPRKSYLDIIRSVLITVHCLHYLKRNPDASEKTLWDTLAKAFRFYEIRPSPKDLAVLTAFLEEKPSMKKSSGEDVPEGAKPSFIVDDYVDVMEEDIEDESEVEEEEEGDVFDFVCAICDNGGELLCCEGRCMRSFHATTGAGEDSLCDSLGYSEAEVEAIENFVCKNCKLKQHQCFVCGKLGSSDKFSGAEVYACVSATCGRFYHPRCVAMLLHSKDEAAAEELQKDIAEGKAFTCPSHKCSTCNQGENKKVPELQFAVCRRCPLSYHRKCLPRGIKFENAKDDNEDVDEDEVTRAWEDLLPNRILIYCLKHDIDAELGTPVRNHIKFPSVEEKRTPAGERKKRPAAESLSSRERSKKASPALDVSSGRNSLKAFSEKRKVVSGAKEEGGKTKKSKVSLEQPTPRKAVKTTDTSVQSRKYSTKSASLAIKPEKTKQQSQVQVLNSTRTKESDQVFPGKQDILFGSNEMQNKLSSSLPSLDANAEKRILNIINDAKSAVTMKDVLKKYKTPSTTSQPLKHYVDKTITMGKLEGTVQAARTALQKLDEGCSIEDAKAVCEPDVLNQIFKWKDKLKVYMSPFINGTRYTSYGRHFTKVEKLQEIVDRLHCYVQDGDTVVDFSCGANDFSCLMAKKMEETGNKCSYKNYDLFPAKNDFNFERRDWFTVSPGELPPGGKLIMGLNPPFGVKATLANKFIDKALEFKPKLLILVVPSETQMLDKKKKSQYKLVWEDDSFLSGKSFYLPGSLDENDKQMEQWNVSPPRIYLWSRQDWISKHKDIARKQGHLGANHKQNHFIGEGPEEVMKEQEAPSLQVVSSSRTSRNNNNNRESQQQVKPRPNSPSKSPMAVVDDDDDDVGVDYAAAIDGILEEINQKYDTDNFEEGTTSLDHHQNRKKGEAVSEADEKLWRDLDARTWVRLYGRQELPEPPSQSQSQSQRGVYSTAVSGHSPIYGNVRPPSVVPTYGRLNPGPDPSYQMNTSTLQRYAPRLDELKHQPRTAGGVGPTNLGVMGRSGFYEPRVPQLGGYQGDPHHQPLPQPHTQPQGFAPGPYNPPFPQSNSSGWLNE